MKFNHINYMELNAKQKEIYNFQKLSGILADYGFNCIKLADDWQGADFLAYHKDGQDTLRIQLKARLTIKKHYQNKELYIAFPHKENWYVIEHDELLKFVEEVSPSWLQSDSWIKQNGYSSNSPSRIMLQKLEIYKLSNLKE